MASFLPSYEEKARSRLERSYPELYEHAKVEIATVYDRKRRLKVELTIRVTHANFPEIMPVLSNLANDPDFWRFEVRFE